MGERTIESPFVSYPKHKGDDENDKFDASHARIQVVGTRHCAGMFLHVTTEQTLVDFSMKKLFLSFLVTCSSAPRI